jgi:hypothetical protein
MDTQQMMEILLSRMDANTKAMNELKEDRKSLREEMTARMAPIQKPRWPL